MLSAIWAILDRLFTHIDASARLRAILIFVEVQDLDTSLHLGKIR